MIRFALLAAGAEWIRTFSSALDRQRFVGSSELGPIYRRTGHPNSCRPRRAVRVVGRRSRSRHSPPGSGGVTTAALSAVRAHRGTEVSNPFPSSGESANFRFLARIIRLSAAEVISAPSRQGDLGRAFAGFRTLCSDDELSVPLVRQPDQDASFADRIVGNARIELNSRHFFGDRRAVRRAGRDDRPIGLRCKGEERQGRCQGIVGGCGGGIVGGEVGTLETRRIGGIQHLVGESGEKPVAARGGFSRCATGDRRPEGNSNDPDV
jgi:hypothetical protein